MTISTQTTAPGDLSMPKNTGARLPEHLLSIGQRYPGFHLAQCNIARMKDALNSVTMEGFVARLAEINKVADESPGFVWRLQSDGGDATYVQPYDDPLIIINMSVWESMADLWRYVYVSAHKEVLRARGDWFEKLEYPQSVLWWMKDGTIPDVKLGVEKLKSLRDQGPTPEAFTWRNAFAPAAQAKG